MHVNIYTHLTSNHLANVYSMGSKGFRYNVVMSDQVFESVGGYVSNEYSTCVTVWVYMVLHTLCIFYYYIIDIHINDMENTLDFIQKGNEFVFFYIQR